VIYLVLQVVFIAALPDGAFAAAGPASTSPDKRPFAGLVTLVGLGWLAWVLYIDAVISPGAPV